MKRIIFLFVFITIYLYNSKAQSHIQQHYIIRNGIDTVHPGLIKLDTNRVTIKLGPRGSNTTMAAIYDGLLLTPNEAIALNVEMSYKGLRNKTKYIRTILPPDDSVTIRQYGKICENGAIIYKTKLALIKDGIIANTSEEKEKLTINLKREDICSIEILGEKEAKKKFGCVGRKGAIVINTQIPNK